MSNHEEMSNDELIGRFNVSVAKSVLAKCNEDNRVKLSEIKLHKNAAITIGNAIKQIASHYRIDEYDVKKYMTSAKIHEINGDLVFVFELESLEAECVVSIPCGYWANIDDNLTVH